MFTAGIVVAVRGLWLSLSCLKERSAIIDHDMPVLAMAGISKLERKRSCCCNLNMYSQSPQPKFKERFRVT